MIEHEQQNKSGPSQIKQVISSLVKSIIKFRDAGGQYTYRRLPVKIN
jgi:hypothetical protein